MATAEGLGPEGDPRGSQGLLLRAREVGLGASFWCAFLLILEPSNVIRAINAGAPLAWDQELIRIAGASLLGGVSVPVQFWLVRRFPVGGPKAVRRLAVQAAACVGVAVVLLSVSPALARLTLPADSLWVTRAFSEQFAANVLLLIAATAALAALLHVRRDPSTMATAPKAASPYPARIAAEGREGTRLVDVEDIDWFESQGNYVAIHENGAAPLVRSTLAGLETRLDPSRFLRIHRRTIVNVARLKELTALDNGDALVRLTNGAELRASRTYAKALRAVFKNR
jgi:DNA-binding LytR/AlgR family response regulator